MNTLSQSTSLAGPMTLTLFKLSFCTTAALRSSLLWTHLPNRDDLFAVFDSTYSRDLEGSITEKKVLKLIRGGGLLENIELDNLIFQARLDEERSRSQQLQDGDRHVIVLVKKPLLAIRYQLPTGQIRRLQMNFRPDSGFDSAYHALRALGLPTRERSPPQSHSLAMNPNTPILPLNYAQQQRPSGLLPSPEFNFRPTTSTDYVYRPLGPSSSAPETQSERPSTAPMTFSQMLPPRRELPFTIKTPRPLDHDSSQDTQSASQPLPSQSQVPAEAKPKRKAHAKTSKAVASNSKASEAKSTRTARDQPFKEQRKEPKKRKSAAQIAISTPAPVSTEGASADMTPNEDHSPIRAQLLPPDVLSSDPLSRTISTDQIARVERRPNYEATSLAKQLLQPDVLFTKPLSGSTQTYIAEQPRANPIAKSSSVDAPAPSRTETLSLGSLSRPAQAEQGENYLHTSKERNRDTLVLRVGSKALAEISAKEANGRQKEAESAQSQGKEAAPESLLLGDISPEEFMSRLDGWVRKYQHLPAPTPQPQPVSDLADYAAQPEEQRLAIIDDMICECLEDENFTKLVADVEQSWKRVGLGF